MPTNLHHNYLTKPRTIMSEQRRYDRLLVAFGELQAAAQKVIDETDRNLRGPWPIKYRAAYGALIELRKLLAKQHGVRSPS